jgi:hypothetical protein
MAGVAEPLVRYGVSTLCFPFLPPANYVMIPRISGLPFSVCLSLNPTIAFYSVFNFANFDLPGDAVNGLMTGASDQINGPTCGPQRGSTWRWYGGLFAERPKTARVRAAADLLELSERETQLGCAEEHCTVAEGDIAEGEGGEEIGFGPCEKRP